MESSRHIPPRRRFALLLCGLLLAGCGPSPHAPPPLAAPPEGRAAQIAAYARSVRGFREAGWLPLIDMEVSLAGWAEPAALVRAMNREGVALAAVTGPDWAAVRAAHRRHPARLVPLTAEAGQAAWSASGGGFLAALRRQLDEGALGIGGIAFDPPPGGPAPPARREVREALEALLLLAEERGVPLWVRMEPEDALLGRLERQLRSHPGASVVWTQAGRIPRPDLLPAYGHALFRALSLRHPRLFFTLTRLPPPAPADIPRPRRHHLFDPDGALSPEWRALLEARIAHFTAGSTLEGGPPARYAGRVHFFRERVLAALSPAARARLAYKNAWRILFGREWEEERARFAPPPRPRG